MNSLTELKNDIAVSLFLYPRTIEELEKSEFLKNTSSFGVYSVCNLLEYDNAIYYKIGSDVMYIKKSWAKTHLKDYELDFRSDRRKELDGFTDFKKEIVKSGLI